MFDQPTFVATKILVVIPFVRLQISHLRHLKFEHASDWLAAFFIICLDKNYTDLLLFPIPPLSGNHNYLHALLELENEEANMIHTRYTIKRGVVFNLYNSFTLITKFIM